MPSLQPFLFFLPSTKTTLVGNKTSSPHGGFFMVTNPMGSKRTIKSPQKPTQAYTSWWFQPIWKILVKMGNLPKIVVKINNIWNHDLVVIKLQSLIKNPYITFKYTLGCPPAQYSGQMIIFHQARFPWNSRGPISLAKAPFGVISRRVRSLYFDQSIFIGFLMKGGSDSPNLP